MTDFYVRKNVTEISDFELFNVCYDFGIDGKAHLMCWEPDKNGFVEGAHMSFHMPTDRDVLILRSKDLTVDGHLQGLSKAVSELEDSILRHNGGSSILE